LPHVHYKASLADIPRLEQLVNSAYRGESSKKGWATEATLLSGGKRIDVLRLEKMIANPVAVILKYILPGDKLIGCVYLEKKKEGLYLGLPYC
jgi:hypothetical protein